MSNEPKLVESTISCIRQIEAGMTDPKDDWDPVLTLISQNNKMHLLHAVYHSPEEKYNFWDFILPGYIIAHRIVEFTAVLSAWAISRAPGEPHIEPRLAPDRKEIVGIVYVTARSNSYYCADLVRRTNRPPVLGKFERMENGEQHIVRRAQIALALTVGTN